MRSLKCRLRPIYCGRNEQISHRQNICDSLSHSPSLARLIADSRMQSAVTAMTMSHVQQRRNPCISHPKTLLCSTDLILFLWHGLTTCGTGKGRRRCRCFVWEDPTEREQSAKLSLFMPVASLLLPFVSSRRQNRIRRDRVVQCSVYNSGSLHQLLNLLLREKEGEEEKEKKKEEGKTDSGKSIFLPASHSIQPKSSPPASLILILPAMSIPPASSCMLYVVSVVPPFHHLSGCHSAAPPPALHRSSLHRTHSHSSVPHSPISEIASQGRE